MARFEEEAEVLAAEAPRETKVQAQAKTGHKPVTRSHDRAALMAAQASA